MARTGRPSEFKQEVADQICERLMAGETLRSICSADNMPDRNTVFRWLQRFEDFRRQYAHAREIQADTLVDESLDIADDGANDWMANNDPDNPGYRFNGEAVARSKLRIDQRKWIAGKMRPKVYGDKVQQEISGPDGGAVRIAVERRIVDPASDA